MSLKQNTRKKMFGPENIIQIYIQSSICIEIYVSLLKKQYFRPPCDVNKTYHNFDQTDCMVLIEGVASNPAAHIKHDAIAEASRGWGQKASLLQK